MLYSMLNCQCSCLGIRNSTFITIDQKWVFSNVSLALHSLRFKINIEYCRWTGQFQPSVQFWGLCSCCLLVVLLAALERVVLQAPVERGCMRTYGCCLHGEFSHYFKSRHDLRWRSWQSWLDSSLQDWGPYLLLFPWPTPSPARRLRRWLGGARLGWWLFGPTVTHACVCPPAFKSVGIKAWRSGLEGLKRRRPEYQELEMWAENCGENYYKSGT